MAKNNPIYRFVKLNYLSRNARIGPISLWQKYARHPEKHPKNIFGFASKPK